MTTPRPLPPMPFEPRSYLLRTVVPDPDPSPTWWDHAVDRLADWLTPARFWGIYGCLILAALLGAWLIHQT